MKSAVKHNRSKKRRVVLVRSANRPRSLPAFSLIELMISIALVLLLILGVNTVFTYTTQAVGSGEAINAAIRNSRAAQATFAADFAGIVPNGSGPNDSACIIISSVSSYSFRNAKDQAAQGNSVSTTLPPAAYLDLAGTGTFGDPNVNGDIVYPSTYNFRNHRLDCLSFFSRGLFHRQTGNPGTFVDNMTSQEAWIWYGHLHLPDNTGNFQLNSGGSSPTFPCNGTSATNPNNFFGSQLVLGRVAILLKPATGGTLLDNNNNPQWYFANQSYDLTGPLGCAVTAFPSPSAPTSDAGGAPATSYNFPTARVDVADTSIYQFRQSRFVNTSPANTPTGFWWNYMMDGYAGAAAAFSKNGHPNYGRFQCNPYIAKPMNSQGMSQSSPYFVPGCSQFIVEFAGDFLTQDSDQTHVPGTNSGNRSNYGDVYSYASDGQVDFTVTYPNGPTGAPAKQIKWYGMPRGTSGSTTINGSNGDVVPVRDWLQNMKTALNTPANPSSLTNAPFEKNYPPLTEIANYGGASGMQVADAQNGYLCAFSPTDPHPKLIRITMTLEDPTGRLPDGQTYQYVFALP